MYTSVAVQKFFDNFQKQFSAYNFVGAVYSPEMDFSKLKPLILNTQKKEGRDKAWCGIIFTRQKVTSGSPFYRKWIVSNEFQDPETGEVEVFKCSQSSCEVNFNIVSNELLHLEALENELQWFYDGWAEMKVDFNKLPSFTMPIGDITYGELTKYNSRDFGKICSLGISCMLNYPVLLRDSNITVIKKINYYLAREMPNTVFYHSEIAVPDEDSDKI